MVQPGPSADLQTGMVYEQLEKEAAVSRTLCVFDRFWWLMSESVAGTNELETVFDSCSDKASHKILADKMLLEQKDT